MLNDADGAGVGEIAYGAAKRQSGVVLFLDLGTGIGSALFVAAPTKLASDPA